MTLLVAWLGGTSAEAQQNGRAVRPDNQDHWEAIQRLEVSGRPCSMIGLLGLDGNAEAVLAAFGEMERRREVRFDGDRAFFAGRAQTMMLDMRDYEVAGILLAIVVYRDCISRRRSAPSFRLDAEAAGRLVFRQDATGRIRSFRPRTATMGPESPVATAIFVVCRHERDSEISLPCPTRRILTET